MLDSISATDLGGADLSRPSGYALVLLRAKEKVFPCPVVVQQLSQTCTGYKRTSDSTEIVA